MLIGMEGGFRRNASPAVSPPPAGETFGPPVPPSHRYSLSVESGSYKSISPPLEWRDIPPLAVITGLNGAGKTQLLQSIAMMCGAADRKDTNAVLRLGGISCQPHEVLFLENFAKQLADPSAGFRHVTEAAANYRREKGSPQTNKYEQQVVEFFQKNKALLTLIYTKLSIGILHLWSGRCYITA